MSLAGIRNLDKATAAISGRLDADLPHLEIDVVGAPVKDVTYQTAEGPRSFEKIEITGTVRAIHIPLHVPAIAGSGSYPWGAVEEVDESGAIRSIRLTGCGAVAVRSQTRVGVPLNKFARPAGLASVENCPVVVSVKGSNRFVTGVSGYALAPTGGRQGSAAVHERAFEGREHPGTTRQEPLKSLRGSFVGGVGEWYAVADSGGFVRSEGGVPGGVAAYVATLWRGHDAAPQGPALKKEKDKPVCDVSFTEVRVAGGPDGEGGPSVVEVTTQPFALWRRSVSGGVLFLPPADLRKVLAAPGATFEFSVQLGRGYNAAPVSYPVPSAIRNIFGEHDVVNEVEGASKVHATGHILALGVAAASEHAVYLHPQSRLVCDALENGQIAWPTAKDDLRPGDLADLQQKTRGVVALACPEVWQLWRRGEARRGADATKGGRALEGVHFSIFGVGGATNAAALERVRRMRAFAEGDPTRPNPEHEAALDGLLVTPIVLAFIPTDPVGDFITAEGRLPCDADELARMPSPMKQRRLKAGFDVADVVVPPLPKEEKERRRLAKEARKHRLRDCVESQAPPALPAAAHADLLDDAALLAVDLTQYSRVKFEPGASEPPARSPTPPAASCERDASGDSGVERSAKRKRDGSDGEAEEDEGEEDGSGEGEGAAAPRAKRTKG